MYMHLCFFNLCRVAAELEKEARMCNLQHVNIVAFFAITFEIGHYGIVMEYVTNGSLEDFVYNYDVRCLVFDLICFVHIVQTYSVYCLILFKVHKKLHGSLFCNYYYYCFSKTSALPLLTSIPDTNCTDESWVYYANFLLSSNVAYITVLCVHVRYVMATVNASNCYPSTLS